MWYIYYIVICTKKRLYMLLFNFGVAIVNIYLFIF